MNQKKSLTLSWLNLSWNNQASQVVRGFHTKRMEEYFLEINLQIKHFLHMKCSEQSLASNKRPLATV